MMNATESGSVIEAWKDHARNPRLWVMISIGFVLLFVFVATFTYANFVLVSDRFGLSNASLAWVNLVFLPAILTTPVAAKAIPRLGAGPAFRWASFVALAGLGLLLLPWLPAFLLGLTLVGVGLFFAQSVATASVARTVTHDHAAANGLYLASYYLGGIVGALVIGQVFLASGWAVSVLVLGGLTGVALVLSRASLAADRA
jgi:predicted MFS family arabinose efflux permease